MPKPWMMIAGASGLAIAVLGYGLGTAWRGPAVSPVSAQTKTADTKGTAAGLTAAGGWVAAAPGRVEPRDGEVRIGTPILGRVIEVLVGVGATVEEGELLVRLDDDEARARMAAAEYEAGARRQERDRLEATKGREDVRRAEDAVYAAERGVTGARFELDASQAARRKGTGSEQNVASARRRLDEAHDRLQRERLAFAAAQARPGLPPPSRPESMVSAGRAEVAIAEAVLDKTRIRSPAAGTVLQQNAKLGEMVAPSPETPLVIIGDIGSMRVKAEVDEADVAKIRIGQKAFVKSQSYPGREFEGTVARIAPTLAPPRIGQRGPRRATDVEVIEVTINLDGKVPLLTGMRVDAYFRK
jgi:HlyD family secretion protein